MRLSIFLLGTLFLFACGKSDVKDPVNGPDLSLLPTEDAKKSIPAQAETIIRALQQQDFDELAAMVHPEKGLCFSPEVSVEKHHHSFPSEAVKMLWNDQRDYFWGIQSGSGDSILVPFQNYYAAFVYDADYATSDSVYFNTDHQYGNAHNNLRQAYPQSVVVEYYEPPQEEQYGGMDWSALRLVFEPYEDDWRLTGIVHAAWTP
ncbi:MAG: hypothetical protein AAF206_23000 [Bacteroidota bacterium]